VVTVFVLFCGMLPLVHLSVALVVNAGLRDRKVKEVSLSTVAIIELFIRETSLLRNEHLGICTLLPYKLSSL